MGVLIPLRLPWGVVLASTAMAGYLHHTAGFATPLWDPIVGGNVRARSASPSGHPDLVIRLCCLSHSVR
jgi:hypothetical protein